MEALLVLEDGTLFRGRSFGVPGERVGEVVFNTGMTGYQEILTDPSYRGQMVVMTCPHIGNTGINDDDSESAQPHLTTLIVRESSQRESSWRAHQTLPRYLHEHQIMALTDVDTRALTRHLRNYGALRGVVSTEDLDVNSLQRKAQATPTTSEQDLVAQVTCPAPFEWTNPLDNDWHLFRSAAAHTAPLHVVAYDCGIKRNILRQLVSIGCRVTVVPAHTPAQDVLDLAPDGVFLSNGPGDPENVPSTVASVKALLGRVPIFGICLGHQILGMALGGRTYKLKFGHHGSNHPVKDLNSGQIAITAQNHNFCVDIDSLSTDIKVTHMNLYDQTLEGMRHNSLPVFSVQFHPEAAPGPHDPHPLFDEFVTLMQEYNQGR